MGCVNVVVLNDFPSTKEAFSQDAFIGRPPEFPFATNKENIGNTYTVMILLLQNRKKLAEFAFKKLYINTENVKRFFFTANSHCSSIKCILFSIIRFQT